MGKFPYLKAILVQNKLDLESTRQVSSFELKEYLESNKSLDSQEISIKNGDNIQELLKKINAAVNESKNELPSNIVSESVVKKANLMNEQGALSFILIGDSTVGKTCFLNRYFKNQFTETFLSTIGIDKEIKNVRVGNDNYKLTVWDTAGQERFRCLPKKYYQNADGVLLLFDVTNEETFTSVSNWMKDVKDNSNKTISADANAQSDISLYLIGNKIDKEGRVITREKAEEMAKSLGMKYFEVSCKINMNIPEVMARMIMECHMKANHIDNCFKLQPVKKGDDKKKKGYLHRKHKRNSATSILENIVDNENNIDINNSNNNNLNNSNINNNNERMQKPRRRKKSSSSHNTENKENNNNKTTVMRKMTREHKPKIIEDLGYIDKDVIKGKSNPLFRAVNKVCEKGMIKMRKIQYYSFFYNNSAKPGELSLSKIEKNIREYKYQSTYEFIMDLRKLWNNFLKIYETQNEIKEKVCEMARKSEQLYCELESINIEKVELEDLNKKVDNLEKKLREIKGNGMTLGAGFNLKKII